MQRSRAQREKVVRFHCHELDAVDAVLRRILLKLGDSEKYEPHRGKGKPILKKKLVRTLRLRLSSIDVASFAELRNSGE